MIAVPIYTPNTDQLFAVVIFVIMAFTNNRVKGTAATLFSRCLLIACFWMMYFSVKYYIDNGKAIKEAYQRVYMPRRYGGTPVTAVTGLDSSTIAQYNDIRRSTSFTGN